MRWDDLFDDLEAQLAAAERDEALAQVAERTRAERAQVGWFDRVAAAVTALRERGRSLLPAGITGVTGSFVDGDPVDVVGPDGAVIGHGLDGAVTGIDPQDGVVAAIQNV